MNERASSEAPPRQPKICFVVSAALTADAFLGDHIAALSKQYEVHLAVNAGREAMTHDGLRCAIVHRVPIVRAVSPWSDVLAIAKLAATLRRERFMAVHSLTPKAGLVAALAGFLARVPVRIHTFTGQVWATRAGAGRAILKGIDQAIAALNTHILVDSLSQRDFLRAQKVLAADAGTVLGRGSVSGVDPRRFKPDPSARVEVRRRLGIAAGAVVFLFVGRLTREKGVLDLALAFANVAAARDDVYLVMAGPDEESIATALRQACGAHSPRLLLVGRTREPELYMAAADVFCLPSYREGFGSVVIEAAAAGLPAIGSRIYGITDAIEDKVTGVLVDPQDAAGLSAAMHELAGDAALRSKLACAARDRALRDFSSRNVSSALVDFYARAVADQQLRRAKA